MPRLYRRTIRTKVAGLEIEKPRQTLTLDRTSDRTQDRGSLDIWNLSEANESRIIDRGGEITIEAGYPETMAVVFEGRVSEVIRRRERLARITRINLGDNVRGDARGGTNAVFNRTYESIESVRRIVTDIVEAMGLEPGPLDAIPADAMFPSVFTWPGHSAAGALDAALKGLDVEWAETDGVIRFYKTGVAVAEGGVKGAQAQSDAPMIMVSPETGLIESPVVTDEGAEIRMLLNPAVVIGCTIELESEALSGSWTVSELRHSGDSWTGQFETFADLREVE